MGSILVKLLFGETGKNYGSNRSFIRRLGSIIPFKPKCRAYLPNDIAQAIDGGGDFVYVIQNNSSPERFTPKAQKTLNFEEFADIVKRMHIMEELMYKILGHIQHLEETQNTLITNVSFAHKLQTIEEQMNKILISLPTRDVSSMNQNPLQEYTAPGDNPLPPPSPPPLPPTSASFYTPPCQVIRKSKSEKNNLKKAATQEKARLSLSEVLKDISSVKLRPVARSPGGNPVRQQPVSNHPSSILTDAIKKKFAALNQEATPEKESIESDFAINSE